MFGIAHRRKAAGLRQARRSRRAAAFSTPTMESLEDRLLLDVVDNGAHFKLFTPWEFVKGGPLPIIVAYNDVEDFPIDWDPDLDYATVRLGTPGGTQVVVPVFDEGGGNLNTSGAPGHSFEFTTPGVSTDYEICTSANWWYTLGYIQAGDYLDGNVLNGDNLTVEVEFKWQRSLVAEVRHTYFSRNVRLVDDLPTWSGSGWQWSAGDTHYHSAFTDNSFEAGAPLMISSFMGEQVGLGWFTYTDHSYELDDRMSIPPESHPCADPDVMMSLTDYRSAPHLSAWDNSPLSPYEFGLAWSALPLRAEEVSVDGLPWQAPNTPIMFRQKHMLAYGFDPADTFIVSTEGDDSTDIPTAGIYIPDTNGPADLRDLNVIMDDLAERSGPAQRTFAYAAHPSMDTPWDESLTEAAWTEPWTAASAADSYFNDRVGGENLLRGFEFWNVRRNSDRDASLALWENVLGRIMTPTDDPDNPDPGVEDPATRYHWYLSGGSDDHCKNRMGDVRTVLCVTSEGGSDIQDALYDGRSFVTDGPYFAMGLDLNGDGDITDFGVDTMMGESVCLSGPNCSELVFDWPDQADTPWGNPTRGTITVYQYDSDGNRLAAYMPDPADKSFSVMEATIAHDGWNKWQCFRAELEITDRNDPNNQYKVYTNPIWVYMEPAAEMTVAADDPQASEIGPDTGTITFTRHGRTNTAQAVQYTLTGTARAPSPLTDVDYTLEGQATIPAGQASVSLIVRPVVDYRVEDTETVVLSLTADGDYTLGGPSSATVEIANAAPPDLATTAFIVSPDALSSGNTVHIRIENLGDLPAEGQYEVQIRLSDDATIDVTDQLLERIYFNSGMAAHQVFEQAARPLDHLPAQDPFQTDNNYWVGAIVVPKNGAFDLTEANNANVGHETDKDNIRAERHLHSPLDGAADAEWIAAGLPFTATQTISAALGDEWIGDRDIDTYQFHANQRQRFGFDIDAPVYLGSSYLRLYDSAWNLLAENEYGAAPDDTAPYHSYLQYTFETAGDYFLAVSSGNNETADPRNWLNRQRGATGAYTLTVSNIVQADLMATVMTASPDRVPSDGRTGVDITLRNDGTADAGGFSVEVWMDDTRVINLNPAFRDGQLVGAAWAAGLAKNTSTTIHLDLNLPCPAPSNHSNRYWLSALVDADGQVTEYNETNNANRAEHADSDAVSAEDHLPCPADGVHVRADPIAPGQTVSAVIGDEWIGAEDLDTYVFTAAAGQTLGFDVDATGGTIDPYLWLFSTSGQMLARNDQEAAPGETVADAYLEYTFAAAGEYWVCVAARDSRNLTPWDTDPRGMSLRSYLDTGTLDYDLTVTALAGPSSLGPRVVSVRCVYNMYLEVVFTEPVSRWSFTGQDVVAVGPAGSQPTGIVSSPELAANPAGMGYRTWWVMWPVFNPDSVTFPPLAVGEYSLTIGPNVADMAGNLMDQDGDRSYGEGHDAYTGQFTVGVAQEYAELSVQSVSGPAFAALNQPASVTVVVANTGTAPSAACNLDLYLSGDTAWGADREVAAVAVGPIPAGQTTTVEIAADLAAAGAPTGDYYWLAYVDPAGLSGEGNAGDNWLVGGAVRVVEELKPNLTGAIGAVGLPAWVAPGVKGTVQVIVHNGGTAVAAGTVRVDLFASANRFLDPLDAPLASLAGVRLNLAPGADATISAKVIAPEGMSDYYYVLALVDAGNAIAESDETDNLAVSDATGRAGWRFGTFDGRKNAKLTVHDALGQPVTFTLSGGGYGVVSGGAAFTRIDLLETGDKSALKIATAKGARLLLSFAKVKERRHSVPGPEIRGERLTVGLHYFCETQ